MPRTLWVICRQNGQGVSKNAKTAVKWCQTCRRTGAADAQNSMGYMYENGQGVCEER